MNLHRKLKLGTRVIVRQGGAMVDVEGVVERHGRDSGGIYTRVRLDTGETVDVHRTNLDKLE